MVEWQIKTLNLLRWHTTYSLTPFILLAFIIARRFESDQYTCSPYKDKLDIDSLPSPLTTSYMLFPAICYRVIKWQQQLNDMVLICTNISPPQRVGATIMVLNYTTVSRVRISWKRYFWSFPFNLRPLAQTTRYGQIMGFREVLPRPAAHVSLKESCSTTIITLFQIVMLEHKLNS